MARWYRHGDVFQRLATFGEHCHRRAPRAIFWYGLKKPPTLIELMRETWRPELLRSLSIREAPLTSYLRKAVP